MPSVRKIARHDLICNFLIERIRERTLPFMDKLSNIALLLSGVSPQTSGGREARFVQIKDLRSSSAPTVMGAAPSARRAVPVEPTDLLLPSRGDESLAVRATPAMIGAFAGLDVYLVRPDLSRVNPDYLLAVLNSESVQQQLRTSATGGALPRIPKQALEAVGVPVPPRPIQDQIGQLGALARQCETLVKHRAEAESRLSAAILSHALKAAM